jgi:hypothetical protein
MRLVLEVDISAATQCSAKREVELAIGAEKLLREAHADRHRWHENQ